MREKIMQELKNRGYYVEAADIMKNNVMCHGIRFVGGSVQPVIYTDSFEAGQDLESILTGIIKAYESHRPELDMEHVTSAEYILEHVRIGMQRKTAEKIIKRACDFDSNIEEYLYITLDMPEGIGTVKLHDGLVERAGIGVDFLWKTAEKNTFKQTEIMDMFGSMILVTNKERKRGASAILDKKALHRYGKAHGIKKAFMLPSSIHECLLVPDNGEMDMDALTAMVQEINGSQVDPLEQLADKAYMISL